MPGPMVLRGRRGRVALATSILALAALNYLWQLGSSSLFVDEGFSWFEASGSFSALVDRVRDMETTPYTYFVFLHEWIGRGGSEADWYMRLPSALAAIALVGAIIWLGWLIGGRAAGLVAGLLAALSPFVLEYAQQVRGYAFLMLLVAFAAAAAISAEREKGRRTGRAWLSASAVAAGGALLLHLSALLAIAPLTVWVGTRRAFSPRARVLYALVGVLGVVAFLPLLHEQASRPNAIGVALYAKPTARNLLALAGAPFDGRASSSVLALVGVGAAALAGAFACLWLRRRELSPIVIALVIPAAIVAPVALVLFTLVSSDVVTSRYAAAAVPFMLVAIGVAVAVAPRPFAAALVVVALASALGGTIASHRRSAFYADVRGAMAGIGDRMRPGDAVVVALTYPGSAPLVEHYRGELPRGSRIHYPKGPQDVLQTLRGGRVWLLTGPPVSIAPLRASLARVGSRVGLERRYRTLADVQIVLAEPMRR